MPPPENYFKIYLTACHSLLHCLSKLQNLQKKAIMNLTNKTLTWLLAGMVSVVLAASTNAQTTKERTGKVVRIKGAARYSTGSKTWQPLKVGTILKSGSVVQTAADSYADIVLNEEPTAEVVSVGRLSTDPTAAIPSGAGAGAGANRAVEHDVVRVQSDSVLAIDKVSATDTGADRVTETELDLRTGSIFFSVKKQAAASRFEVKIPNGVAGIRGTMGLIYSDGRIICGAGSVVSAYTDDSGKVTTKVVPAGSKFDRSTGQVGSATGSEIALVNMISQDTSYSSATGKQTEFLRAQNLGREHVSQSTP